MFFVHTYLCCFLHFPALLLDFLEDNYHIGKGVLKREDVKETYINKILEHINLNEKLKISIDCGNGSAGIVAKEIYERLGCDVDELYGDLDGSFPNHHPDPSKLDNMEDLMRSVKENGSSVGLAFDGDADRLGVISADGEMIYPDRQMILFARQVINNNPHAKIVFDVKCSKLLPDEILKLKGEPLICKTGHTFIKQKIRETNALLGGEMSGHIFFNDRWPGFDDGIYAGARILEIIAESKDNNVFSTIPKIVSTPEINISAADEKKFNIVEEFIKNSVFVDANIVDIDGIRVEFSKGWGLLRASNTSPFLVLRFEAETDIDLEEIKNIFYENLKNIINDLEKF